jgi:hypothetical protein
LQTLGSEELKANSFLDYRSCNNHFTQKDDRFTIDNPKGVAAPGAETIVTITYKSEDTDPLVV